MHITAQGRTRSKKKFSTPFSAKQIIAMLVLYCTVVHFSIYIIYNQHQIRKTYAQAQETLRKQEELKIEQGQLLLEKATLASNSRVEEIASKKLNMLNPTSRQIKVININLDEHDTKASVIDSGVKTNNTLLRK